MALPLFLLYEPTPAIRPENKQSCLPPSTDTWQSEFQSRAALIEPRPGRPQKRAAG